MQPNRVKEALRQGKVQLGTQVAQFGSPELPKILAAAGFHWFFVDAEHGGLGAESVQALCRMGNLAGICPVVRVADLQYALVARALDSGAQGLILPRVECPDRLATALSWMKFPPAGIRGYGLSPFHLEWQAASFAEVIEHANRNVLAVFQIETRVAFDRREELLAVPGIDVALVGPADLSISLGLPGQFDHPRMVETIEAIRDSCRARGIVPGIQTRNETLARFWKERGMLFLGCGNEASLLYERARQLVSALS